MNNILVPLFKFNIDIGITIAGIISKVDIKVTMLSGILETASKPLDAQPRFRSKLLVLFPNNLSGLLYFIPIELPP